MSLTDLTSRNAVLRAIEEYDRLGEEKFLQKYGFGPAKEYFLYYNGREYPSKAIAGVAHGYQFPKPLLAAEFNGGKNTVQPKLEELEFEVIVRKRKQG